MGRTASGWKLRQRSPGHAFSVRFWINGAEVERSTGTSDPQEAGREAARIYADAVSREPKRTTKLRTAGLSLEELLAQWIVSLSATHDPGTCKTWELYAFTHWLPHFGSLHHLNEVMCADYMRARLLKVRGDTVRKELSALRQFVKWLTEIGALEREVVVPGVPKRAVGVAFEKRRRSAPAELSPDECRQMVDALPDWSTSKKVARFPIRARFLVAYETGLRPSALDALEAGIHYRRGSDHIALTPELDKNRWARRVPLSDEARRALDAVCPERGRIFGSHDYRPHIAAAAKEVLPPERADTFAAVHLRSARITHWLEVSGNLPGVQYLAGHKQATTTARYTRPSLRAAQDVLSASAVAPKKAKRRKV